ncbi:MAG: hypothetical protein GXP56_06895 [Deltaproteobacteria bacterium]|nr:hypothetical protein [Deltaproteobacteria bacterium]
MGRAKTENKLTTSIDNSFKKKSALIVVFIPITMLLVFSFSVLYYGTPDFRVDKTQYGLKVEKIHHMLNPVKEGDVIISINSLSYNQILSLLIFPEPLPGQAPAPCSWMK